MMYFIVGLWTKIQNFGEQQTHYFQKRHKYTDEIITKNEELDETLNSFFSTMVDNLKIEHDINRQADISTHPDPVLWAIETFKYNQSIINIKGFMTKVCCLLSAIILKK